MSGRKASRHRFNPYAVLYNLQQLARIRTASGPKMSDFEQGVRDALQNRRLVSFPIEIYDQQYKTFNPELAAVISTVAALARDTRSVVPVRVVDALIVSDVQGHVSQAVESGWLVRQSHYGLEWVRFADDGYRRIADTRRVGVVDMAAALSVFVELLADPDLAGFYAEELTFSDWDRKVAATALLALAERHVAAAMKLTWIPHLRDQLSNAQQEALKNRLLTYSKREPQVARELIRDFWEQLTEEDCARLIAHLLALAKTDEWTIRLLASLPVWVHPPLAQEYEEIAARKSRYFSYTFVASSLLSGRLALTNKEQRDLARELTLFAEDYDWASRVVAGTFLPFLSKEEHRQLAEVLLQYAETKPSAARTLAANLLPYLDEDEQTRLTQLLFYHAETSVSAANTLATHLIRRLTDEERRRLIRVLFEGANKYLSAARTLAVHVRKYLSRRDRRELLERLVLLSERSAYGGESKVLVEFLRLVEEDERRELVGRLLKFSGEHTWPARVLLVHLRNELTPDQFNDLRKQLLGLSQARVPAARMILMHLREELTLEEQRKLLANLVHLYSGRTWLFSELFWGINDLQQQEVGQWLSQLSEGEDEAAAFAGGLREYLET